MLINTEDCWLYAGAVSDKDYGRIWAMGKYMMVHRLMWMDANSRVIPESLHVDHLCRIHRCINPAHLEVVTPRENILRGVGRGALYAKRRACKWGHEFTPGNTRMHGNIRRCRACVNESVKRFNAKKRHAL